MNILYVFFEPTFDLIIALILVASSLYLTRQLRNTTRQKQNKCLLVWHQINFFLLIVTMASKTVLYVDYISPDKTELEEKQLMYKMGINRFVKDLVDYYVDLFLLWLLYRFMRP